MPGQQIIEECVLFLDVAHRLRRFLTERTREITGLTLEQVVILCRIDMAGGSATISHLATAVARSNHNITGMIHVLERRGLVARQRPSTGDHRYVWVALTNEGARRLQAYRNAVAPMIQPLTSPEEGKEVLAHLSSLMERLMDLLPE